MQRFVWQVFRLQMVHILVHFDDIHLKLSTRAYFEVRFQSILSTYENSENTFLEHMQTILFGSLGKEDRPFI